MDAVINQLTPLLDKEDVIIGDGGNSGYFSRDTAAAAARSLMQRGIHFNWVAASRVVKRGRWKGPSMMPGGPPKASWEIVAPIFTKIAALVDGEACCRYMGPDGAGHYVKMVHNGIEYGDMQLICEAYAILKDLLGLGAAELAKIFTEWNKGELNSYLIEITSQIFCKKDPDTGKAMVEVILDKAGQKGTGKWTLESAISQGVVVSTINAAVEARVISSRKAERIEASKILPQRVAAARMRATKKELIAAVHDARFTPRRSSPTRKGWSCSARLAVLTTGTCILATSPPSGAEAALSGRNFSTASRRRMSAMRV